MRYQVALVLAALHGCGECPFEDYECGPGAPLRGRPGDFAAPLAPRGAEIEAPARCEPDAEGGQVTVRGLGERRFAVGHPPGEGEIALDAWMAARVNPVFEARRFAVHGAGFGFASGCPAPTPGVFVHTSDWAEVGPLADHLASALAADGLGEAIRVVVGPEVVACPQVACGV